MPPDERQGRDGAAWVRARAPLWQALAVEVARAPTRSRASITDALRTLETYRTLARDLASARELVPGSAAAGALEDACSKLHVAVSRPPRFARSRWLVLLRDEIPAAARSVRVTALWIAALLVASGVAGWWLITAYPELIGLIASEQMISGVEQGHLWTETILTVAPPSVESFGIFSNNVTVTFVAFCTGFFFGLGTFYMMTLNGLLVGGLLAFTYQHGLMLRLVRFMLAHAPVELSVMCLAGAAGTALGESLIRPTLATRAQSFRACASRVGPLLLAFVPLLLGSGIIEGFISPNPHYSILFRLVLGWGYWLLMLLFLSGKAFRWGAQGHAPTAAAGQAASL